MFLSPITAKTFTGLDCIMSNTEGVLWEAGTSYPSREPEFASSFLVVSVLLIFSVFRVVLSCVFTFWVPCDLCLLAHLFSFSCCPIMRLYVLSSMWFVFCLLIEVFNPITYCVVFFFCFSSSCVPYVASFSGLFFFVFLRLVEQLK